MQQSCPCAEILTLCRNLVHSTWNCVAFVLGMWKSQPCAEILTVIISEAVEKTQSFVCMFECYSILAAVEERSFYQLGHQISLFYVRIDICIISIAYLESRNFQCTILYTTNASYIFLHVRILLPLGCFKTLFLLIKATFPARTYSLRFLRKRNSCSLMGIFIPFFILF